ncbi:MAG: hypothetical protein JXR34_13630 [Bacteroidales bacterium]|nr:hypothetical protein [Bacteroidales bacterium]
MKQLTFLFLSFLFITLIYSCKSENKPIEDGVYSGTFKAEYSSGFQTGSTVLEFNEGRYLCHGNQNRFPAGGSGTFMADEDQIVFQDENFWTADFDWNLILNGTYDYEFDGKNLKIWASKNDVGIYSFVLVKQNN